MRRRTIVIIVIVLAILFAAVEFNPLLRGFDHGFFELTVHISSSAGQPLWVSCEVFHSRYFAEKAHAARKFAREDKRSGSRLVNPFDGQPVKVLVTEGKEVSPLGTMDRHWQFEHLVVVAELPDGKWVSKLVDIPDGRKTREIAVSLP
jgi:hypothetical protein